MGDSYSSGEGASEGDRDYYAETNYRSKLDDNARNACHRSTQAWSRQATMPGGLKSIGTAAELGDTLTCPTVWVPAAVANWRRGWRLA
ncbi:hypothetical protein AB0D42_39345 [Streptomyces sp. NPDC048304]|uniref:hypothetical protein n=1 Tax=Streptomyces sp. NPDC048304 TaxID=3154820 RepID=UPI0033FADA65